VHFKTYGAKDPVKIHCPLCGEEPILNQVQTLSEREIERDKDARERVNVQRYRKRHGGKFVPIPMTEFLDDSLPE
jgi:hypothetical protein